MFSGIIESLGVLAKKVKEGSNVHLTIKNEFSESLYIDQSIAHNGVCLTVVDIDKDQHTVTAIKETMERSNLNNLTVGDFINLERCITPKTRLDGHYVQGHVDTTTICVGIEEVKGSWYFTFLIPSGGKTLLVDKGSIAINGVSLTVISPDDDKFKVAIIPYTYNHTSFRGLKIGDVVNIEYDILGKYVAKHMENYK